METLLNNIVKNSLRESDQNVEQELIAVKTQAEQNLNDNFIAEETLAESFGNEADITNYSSEARLTNNANNGRQIITVYQHRTEGWWVADADDNNNFESVSIPRHLWWEMQGTADVRTLWKYSANSDVNEIQIDAPASVDSSVLPETADHGSLLVALAGIIAVMGISSI